MSRKSSARTIAHKRVPFVADEVKDDGTFTGYASIFGNVDLGRDIVVPGAFTKSLAKLKAAGDPLPMLWQHDPAQPIGGYDELEEDERGLRVKGFLLVDDVPLAAQAHALMKRRIVKGLSIGYYVLGDSWNEKDRTRSLTELDLFEVSPVTFPMNTEAQIDSIKSRLQGGQLPSLPEFEDILREAGFSKSQAAVIANRGLKSLLDRSESGGDTHGILASLQAFNLTS